MPLLFSVTGLISNQLHPWLKIPSSETQKTKLTENQFSYTENIHMSGLWSSCQFHYQGKASRCNLPVRWRRLWSVLVMRTQDEVSWELVMGNSTVSFGALASTWKEKQNPQNQEKHGNERISGDRASVESHHPYIYSFSPRWTQAYSMLKGTAHQNRHLWGYAPISLSTAGGTAVPEY